MYLENLVLDAADPQRLGRFWEAVVGASETVLKNQRKNQFATRVELSGSVHQQDVSAFWAVVAILRNGFIQAFNARYEQPKPSAD